MLLMELGFMRLNVYRFNSTLSMWFVSKKVLNHRQIFTSAPESLISPCKFRPLHLGPLLVRAEFLSLVISVNDGVIPWLYAKQMRL